MGVIVITGATGFLGTNLVSYLRSVRPFADILCLGRNRARLAELASEGDGIAALVADVTDPDFAETVAAAVGDRPVESLVHLASRLTSPSDDVDLSVETIRVNGLGTIAVWRLAERLCRLGGIASVVHASSILVYGHPGRDPVSEDTALAPCDVYGASKAGSEHVARYFAARLRVPLVVVRPGFIYGPKDSSGKVIYRFLEAALRGDDLTIRADPATFRDYVHVEDVCRVIDAAISAPPHEVAIINASGGVAVSLARLAASACAVTQSESRVVLDPPTRVHGDPRYGCVVSDVTRLRSIIGDPLLLDDGLRRLVEGFRD